MIALIILSIIFAIQLLIPKARLKPSGLFGFLVLFAAVILVFGFAFYFSWQQYLLWKNDDMGKLFLPPYQNFDYFIFYSRSRFFNPYLLSLFFGIIFLWAAKIFNKKYEERFFWPIEPYLLATAIFLVGHPAWLFYLIFLLLLILIIQVFNAIRYTLYAKRLSLYYLWLPAAILIILISKWVSALEWWQILKF